MQDASKAREATLADLLRILWLRRYVLLAVFLLAMGTGVAYTLTKNPVYEATATIVVVDRHSVFQTWLESRQVGSWAGAQIGPGINARLGLPPNATSDQVGEAVADRVRITLGAQAAGTADRILTITATATDPQVAGAIVNMYLESFQVVLPTAQSVTESKLIEIFYEGHSAPEAKQMAHEVAMNRTYWVVFDSAHADPEPASPDVALNVTTSAVVGSVLGVLAALAWQGVANRRRPSKA